MKMTSEWLLVSTWLFIANNVMDLYLTGTSGIVILMMTCTSIFLN